MGSLVGAAIGIGMFVLTQKFEVKSGFIQTSGEMTIPIEEHHSPFRKIPVICIDGEWLIAQLKASNAPTTKTAKLEAPDG